MRSFLALALLATSSLAAAQTAPDFSAERVRAHVTFLADDKLAGRDAGTPGYDAAAKYVADELGKLGVQPANAGQWQQQVPFVERASEASAPRGVTVGTARFDHREAALANVSGEGRQQVSGDAVFVGWGLSSPENGIDDYAGLDVKGKVVVAFYGTPKGLPSDVAATLAGAKNRMAAEKGAIGVVTLLPTAAAKQFPWDMIREQSTHPSISWMTEDGQPYREAAGLKGTALLAPQAAEALFAGAPQGYKAVLAAADKGASVKGFAIGKPVTIEGGTRWRRFESPNIVGMIPGSDPALKGEAVLLMAHLDHVGTDPAAEGEDKVFNGAMDNAAGVATMLEVARAFSRSAAKPKRTILFAAVTAEEDGLLGSQYLAKHPLAGMKVTSVVNLDMPVLLYDFTDVVAFGAEHSTMGPLVASAASHSGIKLSPDPMPEENLFVRSDHYSFVQEGVPSVFLVTGHANGGAEAFKTFLATHYHKPSDEVTLPFDWNAGAKFARVNYDIARALADASEAPRWYADSPFGTRYAPDAPKATRAAN